MKAFLLSLGLLMAAGTLAGQSRMRDYGIEYGIFRTGPLNAITDVKGVRVGHVTLIEGDSVRTGVTAVIPHPGNIFRHKLPAAVCIGNGYGKMAGYTQIRELGNIETPIVLTNTLGVAAGLGGACLSPLGVWLATLSPDWAVMGAAAFIIAYSSVTMFRKALKAPKATKPVASSSQPDASALSSCHPERSAAGAKSKDLAAVEDRAAAIERAHLEAPAIGWREAAIGAVIGLFAGLASGYVGVGGGFIMVPLMMSVLHVPMKLTSGTSLIAVMILAVPGTITQAVLGNINWVAGIAVACGSIPGAALGAKLIPKVPERQLRFLFAGFLVVAAVLLVVNQLGVWG